MTFETSSAKQQRLEKAYGDGRQKALTDPAEISFMNELAHLINSVTVPSAEEAKSFWAGYKAGLEEKAAARLGPSYKQTAGKIHVSRSIDDDKAAVAEARTQEPPIIAQSFSGPTDAPSPEREIDVVAVFLCILLFLGYSAGSWVVGWRNANQHEFIMKFWMMVVGPFFWTGLVYLFIEERPHKFLKLLTLFVWLYVGALFFPIYYLGHSGL